MAAHSVPPEVRLRCSGYLVVQGKFHEAIAQMEMALEQDPLGVLWRTMLAVFLNNAGIYDRAKEEARKALEIDENYGQAHFALAQSYTLQGRFEEAREAAEKAFRLIPWNAGVAGLLAGLYANMGNIERAERLLVEMRPVGLVVYHTLCSEFNSAADCFEKVIEERDGLWLLVFSGLLQLLRESSRWPALAERMNLTDSKSPLR